MSLLKYPLPLFLLLLVLSCDKKPARLASLDSKPAPDTVINRDTIIVERKTGADTSEFYILERLPYWFIESGLMNNLIIKKNYRFDNRLNPMYLEDDFNGDGSLDLVVPVMEIKTGKTGFAIIHGSTHDVFIVGAGISIDGTSDNMFYIDIWRINRERENEPGIDGGDPLILETHSISIETSEVGGGLIYWNGKGYAYFHQTC